MKGVSDCGSTNLCGILAYGSLIGDPGDEIAPTIERRIPCRTPFEVEFARSSDSRKGGPTLVPYEKGARVDAQILVVKLSIEDATNMLYRREVHKVGQRGVAYVSVKKASKNRVVIKTEKDFEGVGTVLYTSIGDNIEGLNAGKLAELAITSAKMLSDRKDGISYLMDAKKHGIKTVLSEQYEAEILRRTGAVDLAGAYALVRSMQGA